VASTYQPQLQPPGPNGANGRAGADPAHEGGPLTQATLPELVGRLINDVSDLADEQIELAKQEVAEAKDEALGATKRILIGAGIAVAAALLLVIWAWTAFIWFFNWLGAFLTVGPVTFAWIGWVLGVAVPALAAFLAYKRFISGGIDQARGILPPLPRTRATLKEDLEWVRRQRIPSGR
jgi:putative superfamily III holin-X